MQHMQAKRLGNKYAARCSGDYYSNFATNGSLCLILALTISWTPMFICNIHYHQVRHAKQTELMKLTEMPLCLHLKLVSSLMLEVTTSRLGIFSGPKVTSHVLKPGIRTTLYLRAIPDDKWVNYIHCQVIRLCTCALLTDVCSVQPFNSNIHRLANLSLKSDLRSEVLFVRQH